MKKNENNRRTGSTSHAWRTIGMFGVLALALTPVQRASAASTNSDSFAAPDHTALNGRTMDAGGLTWGASANLEIVSNRVVQIATSGDDSAGVPFSTSGLVQFSVSADVHPHTANWIGIGFGTGPSHSLVNDSPLWVIVDTWNGGQYTLFMNGAGVGSQLAIGSIPNYSSSGFNHVQLSYDKNTTYVTLVINGSPIYCAPVAGISLASITSANMELYQQVPDIGVGQVDNFVLTTSTSRSYSYQDTFTATDGTLLNGRWTETGDAIWWASTNLNIESNHVVQTEDYGVIDQAAIAFGTNGIVHFGLSADMHPNHDNWIGVGFDISPAPQTILWSGSTLWVLLTSSGAYTLFHNGTVTTLASGTASPYYSGGFNHVELTYDVPSTCVKLVINGVTQYNSAASGIDFGSVTAAKIMMYNQSRDAVIGQVDNFALTLTPLTGTVFSMH